MKLKAGILIITFLITASFLLPIAGAYNQNVITFNQNGTFVDSQLTVLDDQSKAVLSSERITKDTIVEPVDVVKIADLSTVKAGLKKQAVAIPKGKAEIPDLSPVAIVEREIPAPTTYAEYKAQYLATQDLIGEYTVVTNKKTAVIHIYGSKYDPEKGVLTLNVTGSIDGKEKLIHNPYKIANPPIGVETSDDPKERIIKIMPREAIAQSIATTITTLKDGEPTFGTGDPTLTVYSSGTYNVHYTSTPCQAWATRAAGSSGAVQEYTADGFGVSPGYIVSATCAPTTFNSIMRLYDYFNATALGANSEVDDAVVSYYGAWKQDNLSSRWNTGVYRINPSNLARPVAADYSAINNTLVSDTISYTTWSTSGYNDFTLTPAAFYGINKSVNSTFSLRTTMDATSTWNGTFTNVTASDNGYGIYGAGYSGTSRDPKMVIIYSILPASNFIYSTPGGYTSVPVTFTDKSTNTPAAWQWYFTNTSGNNTLTLFSTTQNPTYTFGIGTWKIRLDVVNSAGIGSSSPGSAWINVSPASASVPASFTTNYAAPWNVPLTLTFTDTSSNAYRRQWVFNDTYDTENYYNTSMKFLFHANSSSFNDSSSFDAKPIKTGNVTPSGIAKFGSTAAYFDGIVGSGITYPNNLIYKFGNVSTMPWAISWWQNYHVSPAARPLIVLNCLGGADGGWYTVDSGTGSTSIAWYAGSAITSAAMATPVDVGNWHHYAFIGNGNGTISGYYDGAWKSTTAMSFPMGISASPALLSVGSYYAAGGDYAINGELDEVLIFNGTAPPISALYQPYEVTSPFFPVGTISPATHTYTVPGNYTVGMREYNMYGGSALAASTTFNATIGAPFASFSQSTDNGNPGLLVAFTDSSTQGTGTSLVYNWSFGDAVGTQPYSSTAGSVQHVYSYSGIFTPRLTVTNANGTSTTTGSDITISVDQNQQNTWTTPHQVTFNVLNGYGNAMGGITVNATANGTTMPDDYLTDLYGMKPAVANEMLNGTLIMQGNTGTEGSVVFIMHPSISYDIRLTNPTDGTSFFQMVMPSGDAYNLRLNTGQLIDTIGNYSANAGTNLLNTSLTFDEPNSSFGTMRLSYKDISGRTTNVKFYVFNPKNGTVYYSQDLGNPGTGIVLANYTARNQKGEPYTWNYTATRV